VGQIGPGDKPIGDDAVTRLGDVQDGFGRYCASRDTDFLEARNGPETWTMARPRGMFRAASVCDLGRRTTKRGKPFRRAGRRCRRGRVREAIGGRTRTFRTLRRDRARVVEVREVAGGLERGRGFLSEGG